MAGPIPDEVLLGRIRQERLAREAALASLQSALSDVKESVRTLASKTSAKIAARTVDSSALISTIERVVTSPGFAMAERIDKLEATVDDGATQSAASITEIRRAIATSEYALAEIDQRLVARINNNEATVTTTLTAYATKTFAEAKRDEAISAAAADATAKVTTESTARASADTAIASTVSTLDAQVNHASTGLPASHARITTEENVRASAVSAVASRTTTLESQVQTPSTGLLARVSTVETTKVDASGAYAEANSAISASLASAASGTIGARVDTEASARVSADGAIHARWGVNLDVNGRITGRVNLDGNNATSTFTVLADAIRFYNGTSDVAPFAVSGGIVKMQNVVVAHELDIGTSEKRVRIDSAGLRVGNITVDGATSQQTISISGSFPLTITAGNANAAVTVGVGAGTRTIVSSEQILGNDGTNLKPTYAFESDTDTGIKWVSSGYMDFVCDGTPRAALSTSLFNLAVPLRLSNAFTVGAPVATGYVTLQDSSGITYKVLVGV